MKYTLDASGKKIGRLAAEAATLMMGKNTTEFVRNAVPDVELVITNASKADVSIKKMKTELHSSYSGFPSGIKTPTIAHVIQYKGYSELFRKAIYGMLPHNKLRARMMKRLIISE